MCGLVGLLNLFLYQQQNELEFVVMAMAASLRHRGPDDSGVWVDAEIGIALGHRRLSIVDLSPSGHQPMHSACDRYVIAFNGEIYNFQALRQELHQLKYHFRGNSDTEVMLAAISEWGLEKAIKRFIGMFAFALWDRKERVLHLVRDRLGEKPLYYGWMGDTFLFGSELKALQVHPQWQGEIDRDVLALFLRHSYIPAPYSIYKNIYKLPPGTILTLTNIGSKFTPRPVPYWSAKSVAESGITNPFSGSDSEAIEQLDSLLRDAIRQQMVADVPLGAFLSGGIDSSTIVALMQAQSDRPVKTFTIGFHEDAYNEANYAKAVARHLGTDHTELYVTPEEAIAVIPKLPTLYDEPFSDASQIPTFLLSQLAKQYVTVSLSGDGGDELFAGYNRHFWGRSIWQKIGWLPKVLRQATALSFTALSPPTWDGIFAKFAPLLPTRYEESFFGERLHQLAEILAVDSPEAMYIGLISYWKEPESVVVGGVELSTILNNPKEWANLPDFTQRMMYFDMITYLPDDILVKVDRASMGVSLETRVPFLDRRLVEFAWQIPLEMKLRNGQGKWLLRQVLYKYLPQNLIERPKMGFGVPIDDWLRGGLRDWAEALLDAERLREEGFFNLQPIRQKWTEHVSGERNWQYHLWNVLIFQSWLDASKT